jgi:DNA invertase Pin-like site-specific DNA recombinase
MTVVSYNRVSSAQQSIYGTSISLQMQEAICAKFANDNKLKISQIYKEVSSAYNANPPVLLSICSKRNQTIIISDSSRFSRNIANTLELIELINNNNNTIILINEELVYNSESNTFNDLIAHIKTTESESKTIGKRVSNAITHKKRTGTYMTKYVPYGFQKETLNGTGVIVPHPDETKIIQFMRACKGTLVTSDHLNTILKDILGIDEFAPNDSDPDNTDESDTDESDSDESDSDESYSDGSTGSDNDDKPSNSNGKQQHVRIDCYNENGDRVDKINALNNRQIASLLNEYDITRRGKPWTSNSVRLSLITRAQKIAEDNARAHAKRINAGVKHNKTLTKLNNIKKSVNSNKKTSMKRHRESSYVFNSGVDVDISLDSLSIKSDDTIKPITKKRRVTYNAPSVSNIVSSDDDEDLMRSFREFTRFKKVMSKESQ